MVYVNNKSNGESIGNFSKVKVPAGQLYLIGDNRGNSLDSRHKGFIPQDNVYGKPKFVYLTKNIKKLFDSFNVQIK